jgi:hypothetical protein
MTGSGWTSVRTAVEAGFPGYNSSTASCATFLHPTKPDFNSIHPGSRRAYATFCYFRPWPAQVRASRRLQLQLQWTCICPSIPALSPLATHLSLPTAHQLRPAPPITCDLTNTRPCRTDSSRLSARLRPASPPACRPNCPGRLAWTRQLLGRTAQRLHAGKPCHAGSHGTLQKYHLGRKSKKKSPNSRCNNAFGEPGGYVRTSAPHMAPALFRSFGTSSGPSSRAPSRTSSGASSAQQQIAPLARAGLRTAIRGFHA